MMQPTSACGGRCPPKAAQTARDLLHGLPRGGERMRTADFYVANEGRRLRRVVPNCVPAFPLSEWLLEHGTRLTAIDVSAAMVVASLVMHHLEDWDAAFAEIRRVL